MITSSLRTRLPCPARQGRHFLFALVYVGKQCDNKAAKQQHQADCLICIHTHHLPSSLEVWEATTLYTVALLSYHKRIPLCNDVDALYLVVRFKFDRFRLVKTEVLGSLCLVSEFQKRTGFVFSRKKGICSFQMPFSYFFPAQTFPSIFPVRTSA